MLARSSLDVWELSRLVCGRCQLSIRDPDTGTAATTTPKMSTSTCWWSRSAFITGALFRFYHFPLIIPSFLFHSAQQCCVTTILSRVFSCLFVCSLFRLAFVFERHQMLQTRRKPVWLWKPPSLSRAAFGSTLDQDFLQHLNLQCKYCMQNLSFCLHF